MVGIKRKLYFDCSVLRAKLGEGELWYSGRRGGWDWEHSGLPVGVEARIERSGDGSLLLGSPGANRDLTRGDGPQVNLLLTLPHLSIYVIYILWIMESCFTVKAIKVATTKSELYKIGGFIHSFFQHGTAETTSCVEVFFIPIFWIFCITNILWFLSHMIQYIASIWAQRLTSCMKSQCCFSSSMCASLARASSSLLSVSSSSSRSHSFSSSNDKNVLLHRHELNK